MNVLFTSDSRNPYIGELINGISNFTNIKSAVKDFWFGDEYYDIIHIQWPEELTQWNPPDEKLLEGLKERVEFWRSRGSKLVATRHNLLPNKPNPEQYQKLYTYVYNTVDHVVHLGEFSLHEFINNSNYSNLNNSVIHHHIYESYPNLISKSAARRKMLIPQNSKVILCFGEIRTDAERDFILRVFNNLKIKGKFLLVPKFYSKITHFKKIAFSLFLFSNILFKKKWLGSKYINDDAVQDFFNASDIVLIPRINSLTSGVLYLALAFRKPIVGPASGNMKEQLDFFKFDSYNSHDYSDTISKVEKMLESNADYSFYSENMTLSNVSKKHIELYKLLLS